MTIDLEGDLRSEFDAVTPPSSLTFHPESIVRQGNRTIRRRRIIAGASAAMAVALVATGAGLLTRPHDTAAPQPATGTKTSGVVRAQVAFASGTFGVEINRDSSVESKVQYYMITPDGQRLDGGGSSIGKPGMKLTSDATWGSGVVGGRPLTIGLVPSPARDVSITFADGASYDHDSTEVKGTGYTMFAVDYPATARLTDIASIRWTGPTGIVDGIEGDHRLTGRILPIDRAASVEVLLRPGKGGRDTVFGRLLTQDLTEDGKAYSAPGVSMGWDLEVATTDPSGAAVMTGRRESPVHTDGQGNDVEVKVKLMNDMAPVAAGVLPRGASNIGVVLTTNEAATGMAVSEPLPDGRVIFALDADFGVADHPSRNSIKAIFWTNADGTQGRIAVTQHDSTGGGVITPGR